MDSEETFLACLQRINEDTSSSDDEIKKFPQSDRPSLPPKSRRSVGGKFHGSRGAHGHVFVPSRLPQSAGNHVHAGTSVSGRTWPPSDHVCDTLPLHCSSDSQQAVEEEGFTSFETCPEGPIVVDEAARAPKASLINGSSERGRLAHMNKADGHSAKSRSSSTATTISWVSLPENARMTRRTGPSRVADGAKLSTQSGRDAGKVIEVAREKVNINEHEEISKSDVSRASAMRRSARVASNGSQERSNALEKSRRKAEGRIIDLEAESEEALALPSPARRLRADDVHESPRKQAVTPSVSKADLVGIRGSESTRKAQSRGFADQRDLYFTSARKPTKTRLDSAALISPPRRKGLSRITRSITEAEKAAASSAPGKAFVVDMDNSYEVPDSQPDNIPTTPPPSTPRRRGLRGRENVESFRTKPDRRRPANSQSPEDPHRMDVFRLVKKVNVSPFRPDLDGNRRKKRKTSPCHDEDTPPMTPARPSPSITNTSPRSLRSADDLDAAIQEVKSNPEGLNDVAETDNEGLEDDEPADVQDISTSNSWQKTFACMHANDGTSSAEGPNANTIAILQRMVEHYERTRDTWRSLAYRKAIGALKKQKEAVTTSAQATKIPGIGARLADKIEEISRTSRLKQLEHAESNPNVAILKTFTQVYGAGLVQARSWIARGFKTLDDLRQRADLTPTQKIGLEHYDDFLQRIPRDEVKAHGALVDEALLKVSSKLRLTIGGSFRRGSATSGDIDFMITTIEENMADNVLRSMVFEQFVPLLFKMGYLKATLAGHSSDKGSKWHGAARLPDSADRTWRRVDILMVPPREWGAALLYFTGNDIFNRSMRLLARKKGMNLNQHGLYKDVLRGSGAVKLTKGTLVEGKDEERIFEALGVPYRPPEDRVC